MRGKAAGITTRRDLPGITPAYAGKRISGSRTHRHSRDHPRVCGEKGIVIQTTTSVSGSPPRMRGKVALWCSRVRLRGITPAYAGKSCIQQNEVAFWWDHPRVCGEKLLVLLSVGWPSGSPPRMRGKATAGPKDSAGGGITPAYAGKRKLHCQLVRLFKDHPRVCGEKLTPTLPT